MIGMSLFCCFLIVSADLYGIIAYQILHVLKVMISDKQCSCSCYCSNLKLPINISLQPLSLSLPLFLSVCKPDPLLTWIAVGFISLYDLCTNEMKKFQNRISILNNLVFKILYIIFFPSDMLPLICSWRLLQLTFKQCKGTEQRF